MVKQTVSLLDRCQRNNFESQIPPFPSSQTNSLRYSPPGLRRLTLCVTTATMYPAGNLLIPASHGRLEAILKEPRIQASGVALVLHPHPLGGGTMHNKVVFRAAAALNDAGLITLRINFRGVGQSTGEHDEGRGELEDVRAGLDYLAESFPNHPITLCGFSFGARVGLELGISDERVVNLISIGTPVNKYDFSFLEAGRKPILFVHGNRDEYGDLGRLQILLDKLQTHTSAELHVVNDCGHFFAGHLDELKQIITDWIKRQLNNQLAKHD
ncbi:MAG: alpha/beta fold hydrolase [Acidobacteriota bacterium]